MVHFYDVLQIVKIFNAGQAPAENAGAV